MTDNPEVAAARSALVRAIGAWRDAELQDAVRGLGRFEATQRCHVAMLEAIDAYGAACAAAAKAGG